MLGAVPRAVDRSARLRSKNAVMAVNAEHTAEIGDHAPTELRGCGSQGSLLHEHRVFPAGERLFRPPAGQTMPLVRRVSWFSNDLVSVAGKPSKS